MNLFPFNGATVTVSGLEVKGVEYNSIPGKYLGMYKDGEKWRTCTWTKTGKAPKGFERLNLVKPNV